ncbi:MAG: FtsX-like permease family protein [Longimicrobiales bacterium]
MAWLLSGFAVFAVVLATLGLYGVIAFAVGERRREIALRMALGADASRVIGLFLRQSALLVSFGVVLGLAGGYALSRVLASQLHGVSPGDPITYGAVAMLLGFVALVATWLPSWRAARIQPMNIL